MHLMYTLDKGGKRIYTLQKIVDGEVTKSAHPARFSPDDKYSRYAIAHRPIAGDRILTDITQTPGDVEEAIRSPHHSTAKYVPANSLRWFMS